MQHCSYLGCPLSQKSNYINNYLVGAKRKQTKRALRHFYYSPQSKNSISLEVGDETKKFPDSAIGNSLCTSECKPKSEKPLFFSWPPMPLEIELQSRG